MHFAYVLENGNTKSLYIGYTTNIQRRIAEHKAGKSLHTRRHKADGEWNFIYCECYVNKKDALGREKLLKGGSGRNYIKRQLRHYFESNKVG